MYDGAPSGSAARGVEAAVRHAAAACSWPAISCQLRLVVIIILMHMLLIKILLGQVLGAMMSAVSADDSFVPAPMRRVHENPLVHDFIPAPNEAGATAGAADPSRREDDSANTTRADTSGIGRKKSRSPQAALQGQTYSMIDERAPAPSPPCACLASSVLSRFQVSHFFILGLNISVRFPGFEI